MREEKRKVEENERMRETGGGRNGMREAESERARQKGITPSSLREHLKSMF